MTGADFPVSWDLRFLLIQAGVFIGALGLYWIISAPRFRSRYGMLFAVALKSPEHWKNLHRRMGKLFLLLGVIILIPFPTLQTTMKIQLPMALGLFGLGIVVIKNRMERHSRLATGKADTAGKAGSEPKTDGDAEARRLV